MTNNDFYDVTLRRMTRFTIALGAIGALALLAARGPRDAGGFLVGAAISAAGLESWKMLARSLGAPANKPRALALLLGARYLIAGALVYAIVKVSGVTLGAVFAGLLVSLAAVLLEFLYELAFLNR